MAVAQNSQYTSAVFLGSTAFVFLNFGLPIHADDLGFSAIAIGGMYTVFTGTMLLIRPLVGYCLDRFGRRWFFAAAFVFYTAAMLAFSQSRELTDFYIARGLQGIGASLMWVSARTIIADIYDTAERGTAMGRLASTSVQGSMFGAFYGFTLLGFLPMSSAWQWAFLGYAAMSALALIWSLLRVTETKVTTLVDEAKSNKFMTPDLWHIFVVVFLSAFASALIEPIYLLFLKNKFDIGVQMLAFVFLPAGIVYAILPRYAGAWSDRWGRAPIIAIGILFAGLVAIALPFWPSLILVAASYILFSVGWAMASPAEEALVADLAPAHLRGTVIGSKEAASGVGAALGPLCGGAIYELVSPQFTFVVNGSLLLVTALLAWIWFKD